MSVRFWGLDVANCKITELGWLGRWYPVPAPGAGPMRSQLALPGQPCWAGRGHLDWGGGAHPRLTQLVPLWGPWGLRGVRRLALAPELWPCVRAPPTGPRLHSAPAPWICPGKDRLARGSGAEPSCGPGGTSVVPVRERGEGTGWWRAGSPCPVAATAKTSSPVAHSSWQGAGSMDTGSSGLGQAPPLQAPEIRGGRSEEPLGRLAGCLPCSPVF